MLFHTIPEADTNAVYVSMKAQGNYHHVVTL